MVHGRDWQSLCQRWIAGIVLCVAFAAASTLGYAYPVYAQPPNTDKLWSDVGQEQIAARSARSSVPQRYRTLTLNVKALQQLLQTAPVENNAQATARTAPVILSLPLPNGGFGRFQIVASPIMAPELAAKYPEIKTYAGQGIDDPTATVRLDWTPAGFHALILSNGDTVIIDPYSRGDTAHYLNYSQRDAAPPAGQTFHEGPLTATPLFSTQEKAALRAQNSLAATGTQMRTYRLAVATTGEYTQLQGGTVAKALAAIVTTINRVNAIYAREIAVRLVLVANNDKVIFTSPIADPYNNGFADSMADQNPAMLNGNIGNANYDIGHVFGTDPYNFSISGISQRIGSVCIDNDKARAASISATPGDDVFDLFLVAHEIGHQLGANHTFNSDSCAAPPSTEYAVEPGSGSTIMSYAGLCDPDNLQPVADPYFSSLNLEEIANYTSGGSGSTCGVLTNTGNAAPVVDAGRSYVIPNNTPFTLSGSATDPDGDALTYSWEELDPLGAAGPPNNPASQPFFRVFPPTSSPVRTFPRWSDIISNTNTD